MLAPEEIVALAEYLKKRGLPVALPHILAAQKVVRTYTHGQTGSDIVGPVRLTTLLRPVLCSSPEHQQQFDELYLQWLSQRGGRTPSSLVDSGTVENDVEKLPGISWRLILAVGVILILLCLTAWFNWHEHQTWRVTGQVISNDAPVGGARVALGEQSVSTDDQGTFTALPFQAGDLPLSLSVKKEGYFPSLIPLENQPIGQKLLTSRAWLYLKPVDLPDPFSLKEISLTIPQSPSRGSQDELDVPPSPPITLEVSEPATLELPVPPWWSRVDMGRVILVCLPVLLALAVWWNHRQRQPQLTRQASQIPPALKQVEIKASTQVLFPTLSIRALTQRLRHTQFVTSSDLYIDRTIAHTIQGAGLFTPCYGSKREPGYVALIDRSTLADHQANMAAQLVKDLARGSVLVRQFEFDDQPTRLRYMDPLRPVSHRGMGGTVLATTLRVLPLEVVQAKYPTSRLLCFADPLSFYDPLKGTVRRWVATLETWEERYLFTVNPRPLWSEAERLLGRRGFQVIPLSRLGLQLFSHLLEQGALRQASPYAPGQRRESYYDRRPDRWLDRYPPSAESATRLLKDLEQDFREGADQDDRSQADGPGQKELRGRQGMLWLAACAAYPEIHWALTLEWGQRLFGEDASVETLLPQLTRLIWFRRSYMPDWVRQALYDRLTKEEADRISQELSVILSAVDPESPEVLNLYVGVTQEKRSAFPNPLESATPAEAWLQRLRRLFSLEQAAPPGSPLRDFVMLQYLAGGRGKKAKGLAPTVTEPFLKALFPHGHTWLTLRPNFLLGVGVVLSLLLGVWQHPIIPFRPSPIQQAGFVEKTTDVLLEREDGNRERWEQQGSTWVVAEETEASLMGKEPVATSPSVVSDRTNMFTLSYQESGQVQLTVKEDGHEVASVPVPASRLASLTWPKGQDAYLMVVPDEVPFIYHLTQLDKPTQRERQRREDAAKAAAEAAKQADARRQAELAKQKADRLAKEKVLAEAQAAREAPKKAVQDAQQPTPPAEPVRIPQSVPQATQQAVDGAPPPKQAEQQGKGLGGHESVVGQPFSMPQIIQQPEQQQEQVQQMGQHPSTITGKDGAPMVLVPAGEFAMGAREDDNGAQPAERPAHQVYLDTFYIDQYEVTTSLYGKFFRETKRDPPSFWSEVVLKQHGNKPVVGVTWEDANAYCEWAGKRLPTEAQWEKAARGTDQRMYPWGNEPPIPNLANFDKCCDFKDYGVLTDVGSFEGGKSPYEAYDMAGNVWEWVADWYDANFYQQRANAKGALQNPHGPQNRESKVLRGGSWNNGARYLRTTLRLADFPPNRSSLNGFRCAEDAPSMASPEIDRNPPAPPKLRLIK